MEDKKNSTKETENNTNDKLDSLRLDEDDDSVQASPTEDKAQFDAFMAEYRSLMSKNMRKEEPKEEIFEEQKEIFKAVPGKKTSKKPEKNIEDRPFLRCRSWC